MKKLMKYFTAVAVGIALVFSLASCKKKNFYTEWHAAGATIEKDNNFKYLTLDEVVTKRETEDFIIFIASSENSKAASLISDIQTQADTLDFDGDIYVVSVKKILGSLSKMNDAKSKLLSKEVDPGDEGLIAVCYKENKVYFDTSKTEDEKLNRFKVDGTVSFNSIAIYSFELFNSQAK